MSPSILVMDEPSAALDPAARRRLIELLRSFSHTRIIATHDLDLVLDVCSRVLVMERGELRADGPPAQIFADAALLASCRLEPPLSWRDRQGALRGAPEPGSAAIRGP
jgi:cobalt/nickel transport system ATP-binding protein